MAYATVEELRYQIQLDDETKYDDVLEALLDAASQEIDDFCNRPDGFVAAEDTRIFPGRGTRTLLLDHDFTAVSTVAVKSSVTADEYTAWAATDYLPFSGSSDRPDFNKTPYTGLMVAANSNYSVFTSGKLGTTSGFRPDPDTVDDVWLPTVQIKADWGYAVTCPDTIRQAAITLAARWFERGKGAWADAVGNAEVGMLMFRQKIDPDLALILKLGRYVKPVY